MSLIRSFQLHFVELHDLQIIVLTDQPDRVLGNLSPEVNQVVEVREIPSLGWPEATLYRFNLFLENWSCVVGDIVMYMDADTEVCAPFAVGDLAKTCLSGTSREMTLVQHPGYFQRNFLHQLICKSKFGPWETRRDSAAYVPFSKRSVYVCGGVFWGLRNEFYRLSSEIVGWIESDTQKVFSLNTTTKAT